MSNNPTFKPSEGKREEFRKYLEKNGVMDALTKVLVSLYEEPEKPEDALQFIRDRLAIQAGLETYGQLIARMDEYEMKLADLQEQLDNFKKIESESTPAPEEGGEEGQTEVPPAEEQPTGEEAKETTAAEVAPESEPEAPRKESTAPRKESTAPRKESATERRESAAPRKESTAPRKESTAPRKESAAQE